MARQDKVRRKIKLGTQIKRGRVGETQASHPRSKMPEDQ